MKFGDYLKTLFFILIFLQFAPILIKSIKKQYEKILIPKAKVGLIEIRGILYNSDYYNKYLNKYFKEPSIKAILLKMDCPGGASGSSQSIYQEILNLKRKYNKPVITLIENVCASGGYYVACATDHIISAPSAIVGSIGSAFQYLFQLHEFIEKHNIKYKSITAGKYKTATDPFLNMTPDQEKLLQSVIDESYQQFALDVSKNRKLPIKSKDKWGEGKLFTGNQALKLGLIDSIGSPYNAIQIIREKALIDEKEDILWVNPPTMSKLAKLFGAREPNDGSMFAEFVSKLAAFLSRKLVNNQVT